MVSLLVNKYVFFEKFLYLLLFFFQVGDFVLMDEDEHNDLLTQNSCLRAENASLREDLRECKEKLKILQDQKKLEEEQKNFYAETDFASTQGL